MSKPTPTPAPTQNNNNHRVIVMDVLKHREEMKHRDLTDSEFDAIKTDGYLFACEMTFTNMDADVARPIIESNEPRNAGGCKTPYAWAWREGFGSATWDIGMRKKDTE